MAKRDPASNLAMRVHSLAAAADLAEGRVDDVAVAEARRVTQQADARLAFAGGDTVIALAGATGSGKSSLFNAISGTRLAETGLRRPTTSRSMAAYWGTELPNKLLDWLDVPRRHVVRGDDSAFNGLLLMDLPDHDSTELTHRAEVDRLVRLVDMFVWVVDPQKYADAALHNNYLKPLADHADVMLVVLNQADRLTPDQLRTTMRDLRRLLDSEGLSATPCVAASALTGMGVEALRKTIAASVRDKQVAAQRLTADVVGAGRRLRATLGDGRVPEQVPDARVRQLSDSLAVAAGVDMVQEAVLKATRHRGSIATGWPVIAWLGRFRPDPLRLLHLDRGGSGRGRSRRALEPEPVTVQRTSLPSAGGVQMARVDSALRDVAGAASQGLPDSWARAVRETTTSRRGDLPDRLDRAVATTDLGMDQGLGWWRAVSVVQWIIFVVALVGGLWLLADVVLAYLQLPTIPRVAVGRLPLPTVLLLGGVAAGVLVGLVARVGVELGARSRAARAERVLTRSVARVADELVVGPVNLELKRFTTARDEVTKAIG
ncbi:50S ribosome-binding GTPase [Brooklawnia cerclae]|uniref:GTP-binding protein EngB required for normal cell division n=1 Tax=Brooklawnia cerclae TaxID=349934 RepID=A0ABX0SG60_9ACTN|nr:GTPase [Brooklawnia cerclae]NIH57362.1 GTP-binding protein EngB required for normal cell division [Brooklawnia cerclae]